MSYLLRHQHRLSSKPGGLGGIQNNKAPSSLLRSSLGLQRRSSIGGGGGGGQIQIQRQHHAQPPQQQQQRVQGVISMEEGMSRKFIFFRTISYFSNSVPSFPKPPSDG